MPRKSTRENKSVYQLAREKEELTLEGASERLQGITADRLQKIESGSIRLQPEDVMLMAEAYKAPELRNHYCTHECPIGRETMNQIELKSVSQIAVETLNALNRMNRHKERLLEIIEDGQVCADEHEDFLLIKGTLEKIATSVSELQLWVDTQIAAEKLDGALFKK